MEFIGTIIATWVIIGLAGRVAQLEKRIDRIESEEVERRIAKETERLAK
jgi:hypothetical protein